MQGKIILVFHSVVEHQKIHLIHFYYLLNLFWVQLSEILQGDGTTSSLLWAIPLQAGVLQVLWCSNGPQNMLRIYPQSFILTQNIIMNVARITEQKHGFPVNVKTLWPSWYNEADKLLEAHFFRRIFVFPEHCLHLISDSDTVIWLWVQKFVPVSWNQPFQGMSGEHHFGVIVQKFLLHGRRITV